MLRYSGLFFNLVVFLRGCGSYWVVSTFLATTIEFWPSDIEDLTKAYISYIIRWYKDSENYKIAAYDPAEGKLNFSILLLFEIKWNLNDFEHVF